MSSQSSSVICAFECEGAARASTISAVWPISEGCILSGSVRVRLRPTRRLNIRARPCRRRLRAMAGASSRAPDDVRVSTMRLGRTG